MPINTDHAGVHYYDDLNLSHVSFDGYTSLNGTVVDGRVDARCIAIDGNANLRNMTVADKFYAWAFDTDGNADLSGSNIGGLDFRGGHTAHNLVAKDLSVDGDIDLQRFDAKHIMLNDLDMDGTMSLADTDTEYVDIRGASIPELRVDDLDAYTFRTDDATWVGEITAGYGLPDDPDMTDKEQEFVDNVYDRPRFPVDRRDGVLFTYDDLKRDFVLDAERCGLLGSLQQKDVIHEVDDGRYALVSRQYR